MISRSIKVIDDLEPPRIGAANPSSDENPYLTFLSSQTHSCLNLFGPCVGNDVVDLFDPETQRKTIHHRFDERVFTEKERSAIRASTCAHRARWAHWAAKESAYKVVKKLDSQTVFSPIQFKVLLGPRGNGIVEYRDRQIRVTVKQSQRFVHAIATAPKTALPSKHLRVESNHGNSGGFAFSTGTEPRQVTVLDRARAIRDIDSRPDVVSRLAGQFATETVGSLLRIPPKDIDITSERRVPRAYYKGAALPIDISLSHHGRYVAFAMSYLGPVKK